MGRRNIYKFIRIYTAVRVIYQTYYFTPFLYSGIKWLLKHNAYLIIIPVSCIIDLIALSFLNMRLLL